MTTQLTETTPTPISATSPHRLRMLTQRWLEPRATNRDEAFRERVIRGTTAIIILLGLISFSFGVVLFPSNWELVSFPTMHIACLSLCFASGVAVARGRLQLAGLLLVASVLLGASLLVLLALQDQLIAPTITGVTSFMFVPLVATLVLPRHFIIPISLVTAGAYLLTQSIAPAQIVGLDFGQLAVPVITLLLIEGTLLQQFRVEFDGRLDAMRESIRQAEEAREQAEIQRLRAEQADKSKTQFLANMSHELRTPLNAIIGYDEAMLGGMVGEFAPEQTKLLRHIQHNSRRLLGLINDVLDLSKIESGSVEVFLAPISPRTVVQQTVDSLRSLAAEKQIDLEVHFTDDVPGVILGDSKKLQQILVNLVGNAVKFTEKGSVTVDVSLLDKDNWQFKVIDSGIGIPPDEAVTIFEPFRQVDNSSTRKYKGTGLGLSITKRLVEILKGEITLESHMGKGSVFTVTLPRADIPVTSEDVLVVQSQP